MKKARPGGASGNGLKAAKKKALEQHSTPSSVRPNAPHDWPSIVEWPVDNDGALLKK